MLRLRTTSGESVRAGGVTVTPLARALVVRTPFGGLAWNRPLALLVRHDGRVDRVRIPDVTRRVQLGLLITAAALVSAALVARGPRKEH